MDRREMLAQVVQIGVLSVLGCSSDAVKPGPEPETEKPPPTIPAQRQGRATGNSWEECGRTIIQTMGRPLPGSIRLQSVVTIAYNRVTGRYDGVWSTTDERVR